MKRPHPAAREMAQRLVARFPDDDWSVRLTAYSAGRQAIIERLGNSRQGRRLLRDYATAVVEAFGAPAIECTEQMAIWSGSGNPRHVAEAEAWLAGISISPAVAKWGKDAGFQTLPLRVGGVEVPS
jgi:hypothetical protein